MTREIWKSLVLFILVALSITLTWSIWSYQGEYAPTNLSEPAKINNIASAYKLSEVVKPYQVVRYNKDPSDDLKGMFGNGVTEIYNLLLSGKTNLTPQTTLPSHFPKSEGNVYELIFPTPISTSIVKDLMFPETNQLSSSQDWLIDRVEIFQTDKGTDNAYVVFKDQMGVPVFYAKGDIPGLDKYKQASAEENWLDYTTLHLKSQLLFLPNQPINTVATESHLYSLVGFSLFKPILFSDPRQVVYNGNNYSDGVSQLTSRQKLVMQYYNHVTNGSGTFGDPIAQSYKFINNHKGWTNSYNIDDFTIYPVKGQAQVAFRMTENGLPVFSLDAYPYEYESMISLMWDLGELSKLDRTLINIGVTYRRSIQVNLMTPVDTINQLKKTGAFKLQDITDFKLGYGMTINQNEQSVTLVPSWFFNVNGTWVSATEFLNNHSNDVHGLRGGS